MTGSERQTVVIAGGGVAGLECLIALRELAGEAPEIIVLAPGQEFVYRPAAVVEPFSFAAAHRYPLARIAADHGAELRQGSLRSVNCAQRIVITADDEHLRFDALTVATGATRYERYSHALTVDDKRVDESLHGLIEDVEGGYSRRIAFVMPPRVGWPLPLYEFALLTARRARDMCVEVELTIVTPEDAPLAIFGDAAKSEVAMVLADAGVTVITSAYAETPDGRHIEISPGERTLEVDRTVALPQLTGPRVGGIPLGADGFIPVTPHCEVRGVECVYAAGDGTDFPVKHGSIAAEQADVAAVSIAAQLGFEVAKARFEPVIRGMLMTGGAPLYMTARLIGGAGFASTLSRECPWYPPVKIAATYLGPYLAGLDRAEIRDEVSL